MRTARFSGRLVGVGVFARGPPCILHAGIHTTPAHCILGMTTGPGGNEILGKTWWMLFIMADPSGTSDASSVQFL